MLPRRKPLRRKTPVSKTGKTSLSHLISQADSAFSQFIRLFYANDDGTVTCYTCDTVLPIREMTCGHYITRGCYFLRWNRRNARPQCIDCNKYKDGNLKVFKQRLNAEKPGTTRYLEFAARRAFSLTKNFVANIINKFRNEPTR